MLEHVGDPYLHHHAHNRIRQAMSKIAKDNPLVFNDPAPSVYFMGLGDSSLDFDVRIYLKDLGDWLPMLHRFHRAIVETLAQANIEIPFHQ